MEQSNFMMYGFDGQTEGLESILRKIRDNKEGSKLNHKQVRAYARCLLSLKEEYLAYNNTHRQVIITLLAAMSQAGLPHYDRSFLAGQILEVLDNEKWEQHRKEQKQTEANNTSDDDGF